MIRLDPAPTPRVPAAPSSDCRSPRPPVPAPPWICERRVRVRAAGGGGNLDVVEQLREEGRGALEPAALDNDGEGLQQLRRGGSAAANSHHFGIWRGRERASLGRSLEGGRKAR